MIRKFFGMMLFITTVLTASFGQDVFGRSDIDHWAHNVRKEGPKHATIALKKTDTFLGNLATKAGVETQITCTFDNPQADIKA